MKLLVIRYFLKQITILIMPCLYIVGRNFDRIEIGLFSAKISDIKSKENYFESL